MGCLLKMFNWDECPYCGKELSIEDVYDTTDGIKEEGFATCPRCRKAFEHTAEVTVDFNISSVEILLDIANTGVEVLGSERYKRRQAFLEKLVAYNKMIDDGVLTEEEIEAYSDEWSDGYEGME